MKITIRLILLFLLSSSCKAYACGCPESMAVFGAYEIATLDSIEQLRVNALIDSGATTTALDARNIKMHVNRQGKRWVYFDFVHKSSAKKVSMHQPVSRVIRVITHSGNPTARPVVISTISVGKTQRTIEISLISRNNFPQQLLIGRNYLREAALIDSGRKFLQSGD